jgi:hypothetical protein
MADLTQANTARLNEQLSKLTRIDGYILTIKQLIDRGAEVVERLEGRIEYNRIKFNRMDYDEQATYMARVNDKVTRYYVATVDGYMIKTTKMVFDKYNTVTL